MADMIYVVPDCGVVMPGLTLASSIAISNEVEKFQKGPMNRVEAAGYRFPRVFR